GEELRAPLCLARAGDGAARAGERIEVRDQVSEVFLGHAPTAQPAQRVANVLVAVSELPDPAVGPRLPEPARQHDGLARPVGRRPRERVLAPLGMAARARDAVAGDAPVVRLEEERAAAGGPLDLGRWRVVDRDRGDLAIAPEVDDRDLACE